MIAQQPQSDSAQLQVAEIAAIAQQVLDAVGTVVVGMKEPLKIAMAALLSGGHILFEDVPGLGKTLAARSLAQALGLDFARLQCTPDLLPADITGASVFDPATRTFEVRKGPIFTGLFLADEINRTAPKTQSALLEAMAEGQVSIEGTTFVLPTPFHVIATSNPVEFEGTYPLPEAQLDRFMVRLSVGYLSAQDEADVLFRRMARQQERTHVDQVTSAQDVTRMQRGTEQVHVEESVVRYCVDLAHATRMHASIDVGVSPRGAQALVLLGRAYAVLDGRDYVLPEDIKAIAIAALAHRITLTPTAWAAGINPETLIAELLNVVPAPASIDARTESRA